jgi:hypothetical protein
MGLKNSPKISKACYARQALRPLFHNQALRLVPIIKKPAISGRWNIHPTPHKWINYIIYMISYFFKTKYDFLGRNKGV